MVGSKLGEVEIDGFDDGIVVGACEGAADLSPVLPNFCNSLDRTVFGRAPCFRTPEDSTKFACNLVAAPRTLAW